VDTTGTAQYFWDFENRMTSVTLPGSGGTVTFKHDPFGRRIYKSSSSATSVYGDNLVEETNATGAVVARYAQTQSVDEPLAMLRSSTTSYYHSDGLGTITSLSNAAGALAQTYGYDSFGKQTTSSGSLTNPFQYTGREFDTESNVYYMRARYFDPSTGRFLSEDPIGFPMGDNFYVYVGNSPQQMIGPTGTESVDRTELWNHYKNVGNVYDVVKVNAMKNEALRAARDWGIQHQLPGGSVHNGAIDAFRHCFWSCTMTRYIGEEVAEAVGDEHEKSGNRRDHQPLGEEQMDRANNLVGRSAALSCPKNGKNCWDLCTDLYNQRRLYGLGARPNYFPNDSRR
jgi:RHS repeat-associated protein